MTIAKFTPAALIVLFIAVPGMAADKLPRTEALGLAVAVADDLKSLQNTAIPTDVDLKHPVAIRDGDIGVLALPECKLAADLIQKAGDKVVPIGQLWMHQLAPVLDGKTVAREKLRLVSISLAEAEVTAVQCSLGIQKNAEGALELVVFGKEKTPVLKVPLKKIEAKPGSPLDLEMAAADNGDHTLTLTVLGQYQAKLVIGDFTAW